MDHKLTHEEIQSIKDGRAILLDVRSEAELAERSCSYAKHWDFDEMTRGIFPNYSKDLPIFVFCRSGNRSAVAQSMLNKQGYDDVHNLGGINSIPDELCK